MGCVALRSLTLSGFRSFVDETTIDFSRTDLVLIEGDSGSGKSSLCLAISYALGFCPFPATELVTWGAETSLKVQLVLDASGAEVVIKRTPTLSVSVGGVQVKGGAKRAEEKIAEILGLSPEMLALLTYRGQRQPGLFFSKTDAEKKEFLTKVLGLDKFEKAIEVSSDLTRELEKKVAAAQAEQVYVKQLLDGTILERPFAEVELELEGLRRWYETLAVTAAESKKHVAALQAQRTAATVAGWEAHVAPVQALRDELGVATAGKGQSPRSNELKQAREVVEQVKARLARVEVEDAARKLAHESRALVLWQNATLLQKEVGRQPEVLREQARLQGDLDKLKQDVCPTCGRDWDEAEAKRTELAKSLVVVVNSLASLDLQKQALTALQAEIGDLPAWEPSHLIAQFRQALAIQKERESGAEAIAKAEDESKLAALTSKLNQAIAAQLTAKLDASTSFTPAITAAEEKSMGDETALRESRVAISALELIRERLLTQMEYRAKVETKLLEADASLTSSTLDLNTEKDFLHLIGREGFLGSIFDEVLIEITEETNRILGTVTNTRQCTIAFHTESTTQKGTVRKTIVPMVTVAGHETPLQSGLSGGMLSSVELAVDLAIGAVISRRTGVTPGWLILDESFDGLDSSSKESCMQVLTEYARDRLVLVIDHSADFAGFFGGRISIVNTSGQSRLKETNGHPDTD